MVLLCFLFPVLVIISLSDSVYAQTSSTCNGRPFTCPSSVYFDVHTTGGPDHRLAAKGTTTNQEGARIIELRGWLRIDPSKAWCFNPLLSLQDAVFPDPASGLRSCINFADNPPDFTYVLDLDPTWLEQNGIDINEIVRVGNLLDGPGDNDFVADGPSQILVELMSWHETQTISLWPPEVREALGPGVNVRSVPKPVGWEVMAPSPISYNGHTQIFWPWDPRYPSNVDPRMSEPFHDGDYVRVIGALVIDSPHQNVWKYEYPHIPTHMNDPNNPATWTEIHPVDLIERIDPPRDANGMLHKETVTCIAAVAENAELSDRGETRPFGALIRAPEKPDPLAQFRFIELIDRTVSAVVSVPGQLPIPYRNTIDGTFERNITPYPNDGYIVVRGAVQGEGFYGDYGKFKACYRVFWEPGPPQIRITGIEPSPIMAREPTTIIVYAEDWHNSSITVDGEVIIDDIGTVGRTNTPFNFTFNTNSAYVKGRVSAEGYADAALTFRLVFPPLEVRAEPSTIQINTQTQVIIYAFDPKTHVPVLGRVVTNEATGHVMRPVILGATNETLTHKFIAARGQLISFDERCSEFEAVYPTVKVVAPGYADTVVPITFSGDLPDSISWCRPPPRDNSDDDLSDT